MTLPASLAANPRLSAWLGFRPDGRVRISPGKVEIGQGILTALAQIAADELDVDPARIEMVAVSTPDSPNEGVTSGSQSVQQSGAALRLPPEALVVHPAEGAGCYGHNGADDVALDAALAARALPGRPVRLVWSRADELGWPPVSSAMVVDVVAGLDAAGNLAEFRLEVISNSHSSRPGRNPAPTLLAASILAEPFLVPASIDVGLEAGMRRLGLVAVLVLLAFGASARDLTVVAGGGPLQDHMRRTLFQPFAAANGITVADVAYDDNVGPIRAMVRAGNVTWDVVLVEAPDLVQGCDDGVFERIDWSVVDRQKFLPGGTSECGAGAIGWGVSIFYDEHRHANGPASFAEFWDVARFPGRRAMRRGARMTMEIALLSDGVAMADVYPLLATPEGQRRAFARLDQLRPSLMFWSGGQQPIELISAGEVDYAFGYVGRTANAIRAGAPQPALHL